MLPRHEQALKNLINSLRKDDGEDYEIGYVLFGAAVALLAKSGQPVDKLNEILHELHFEACCESDCAN